MQSNTNETNPKIIKPYQTIITSFPKASTTSTPITANNNDIYDNNDYILHMTTHENKHNTSIATSNRKIATYDLETVQLVSTIRSNETHARKITDLISSSTNGSIMYSSSEDGSIKGWDWSSPTRMKPIMGIQLARGEEALNISLGYNDTLLSVGTSNGLLHFYDVRNTSTKLGTYNDAHVQEVTQVHFLTPPSKPPILLSGSEDGLLSIHDTSLPSEEDALVSVLNVNASIRTIGSFGPQREGIWCLSGCERLSLWHYESAQLLFDFGHVPLFHPVEYGITCDYNDADQTLVFAGGRQDGTLCISEIRPPFEKTTSLRLLYELQGHKSGIRAFSYVDQGKSVCISGGEDARLCIWKLGDSSSFGGNACAGTGSAPIRSKERRRNKKSGHAPY